MSSLSLYRAAELRRIEAAAADQPLMQRAGAAAAELAVRLAVADGTPVLVLAGPGNNGGDAFEVARLLRERFFDLRVVFAGDAERLPADAAAAYRRFVDAGGTTLAEIPSASRWALVIDGLFGIGLKRPIGAPHDELIRAANALALRDGCPLLALDCPSGIDADTGRCLGETIRASHTITFIGAKPGLFTADGPDHCGEIAIADLDLVAEAIAPAAGTLLEREAFAGWLKPRPRNSHKGRFGDAGVLGGAPGMVGAALLAARAALKLGAGRVYAAMLDPGAPTLDLGQPELMLRGPRDLLATPLAALACGPGLGRSEDARSLLWSALGLEISLVLDADALNLIAAHDEFNQLLVRRGAPSLLTPHPAEAGRLLGCSTADVQADRVSAALTLATRYGAQVALKGCGTVIASPDGNWTINANGNPGLATAGSGDVLTGIACALLAQGWAPLAALQAAVRLHGAAADRLVVGGIGLIGIAAGELIDAARASLNAWVAQAGAGARADPD